MTLSLRFREADLQNSVKQEDPQITEDSMPRIADEAEDMLTEAATSLEVESRGGKGLQFSDKDEHMYFWFPLLAGLSELTFDPRPDIRYSALEVSTSTAENLLLLGGHYQQRC